MPHPISSCTTATPALLPLAFSLAVALLAVSPAAGFGSYLPREKAAAQEAWTWGASNFFRWGVQPAAATYYLNHTVVFDKQDLDSAAGANISCFRIPSIVQTGNGTLLAFAEARGAFPVGTCADCAPLGIAMKRSVDGGDTWEAFRWAVDPWFSGGSILGNSGGNPVALYDTVKDRVLLHFVRGGHKRADNTTDCVPGTSNWEVVSHDDGQSWSAPRNISAFLGKYVGSLPGPGNGAVQLKSTGRILFNAHYETAERGDGAVVVYYSDDGGDTYKLAPTAVFPHMDESTMTETGHGGVVINMRNDPNTSGNKSCHCRAIARSSDGGTTWGGVTFDPALNDSVCEASISAMDGDGNLTVFFNPAMQHMRNRPTLKFSFDGGRTWPKSTLVADSFVDYSSLVRGPLIRPPADYSGSGGGSGPVVGGGPVGGVLWGSCEVPVPYRLWCVPVDRIGPGMRKTYWNVLFTRFALPQSGQE